MKARLRKLERRLLVEKRKIVYVLMSNRRDKKTKKTFWEIFLDRQMNVDGNEPIDPIWREFWRESKKGRFTSEEEIERFGRELQKKYPEVEIHVLLFRTTEPQDYISSWMSLDSEEEIQKLMKDYYDKYWHEEWEWEEIEEIYRTLKGKKEEMRE